ncbi:Transmembrane_domain-containing protein [Hexamita inflata]|uniref:Transmembrane domain-containing protein n=1 Tax=Hexamita inflata TaxID=28002 RepID=A0AA86R405_9EUKA|nr:Transmembrane domain-containing protein [Hexamita inflata]CAI9961825.1 Transmembrane domain-containing protein [Hexamita inflata]
MIFHITIAVFSILSCYSHPQFLAISVIFYTIKFFSLCYLKDYDDTQRISNAESIQEYQKEVRMITPQAQFYCDSYHFEPFTQNNSGVVVTGQRKVITHHQTQLIKILSIIDSTEPVYYNSNAPCISLYNFSKITFDENSKLQLQQIADSFYSSKQDVYCSVSFSSYLPLPFQTYVRIKPFKISKLLFWISYLFQFDVLFVCIIRANIYKTIQHTTKTCSITENQTVSNLNENNEFFTKTEPVFEDIFDKSFQNENEILFYEQ